ncbi:uncharacterized protein LOC101050589 [Saimiri boliviensis]|uniref:uncharacterized protein LOC101050589 n=1 Tax=Saimiri boliviensis TaxID=27679 RepID=UPI000533CA3C|nr:POM121-like protein 2 [Saimiri boliviensis boliviensis]
MGNYLSRFLGWPWAQKPRPTWVYFPRRPRPLSQAPEQRKFTYYHGNSWVRTRPLLTAPGRDYARIRRERVPEAQRRFPNRPQPLSNVWPDFSPAHLAFMKRWLLSNARHPQPVRRLATVKIAPPERRGKLASRPSAFKPVMRSGVAHAFVPRSGLLGRCPHFGPAVSPKRCSIIPLLPGGRLPRCRKCGRQWPGRKATTGALALWAALPRHLRLACIRKEFLSTGGHAPLSTPSLLPGSESQAPATTS